MRNERKYKIITLLSVLLGLLLLGNCFREPFRMGAAEAREKNDYVMKGAKLYAINCIQCHGPNGEGVIGMPLNRPANKLDITTSAGKDRYTVIYNTLLQGRAGNAQVFERAQTPDGKWISYTAMPAWHKDYGGPLDDNELKALTMFIMNEDGSQWTLPGTTDAPTQLADLKGADGNDANPKTNPIPLPDSANADVNVAAKALLNDLAKTQCLTCHVIGPKGAKIGPDLTRVGSWGIDQKFIEDWIKYANANPQAKVHPQAIAHDVRMPLYWSANRAGTSPNLNLTNPVVSEGPYFMPRFAEKLTDQEVSTIARYLMGLK